MPLKIRIKPRGKFYVAGAILQNIGSRPIEILVLTDHKVVREEYKGTASGDKYNEIDNF